MIPPAPEQKPTHLGAMKPSAVKFCAILLIMLSSVVVHTDCCSSRSMPKSRPRPVSHFRGVMTSATTTFTVIRPDAPSSSSSASSSSSSSSGTGRDSPPPDDAGGGGGGSSGGTMDTRGGGAGGLGGRGGISSTSTGAESGSSKTTGDGGRGRGNEKDQLLMRMGKCTQLFEENYCLNGGKCYNFTIANSTMPTCECADGFMGERCESKYLDGTYLSMRKPKIHIETASMYYGAFLAMMVVLAVFYYLHWLNHCR